MMEVGALPGPGDDAAEQVCGGVKGDRNSAGNRWSQEETLALLRLRSEMDAAFRDSSSPNPPLWEHLSRKLGELGYDRSAKKCREKFENMYKYHRRTKDGQSDGKMYRFFEQLEALNGQHRLLQQAPSQEQAMNTPMAEPFGDAKPTLNGPSTWTGSSSYKEFDGKGKEEMFEEYVERMMRVVMERQENLQKKFVEMMEKYEGDRKAREEAWKNEELARMKRRGEVLAEERSVAAAKDAAVLSLVQKLMGEQVGNSSESNLMQSSGGGRWPREEVDALIRIRSKVDVGDEEKFKGRPLWELVSGAMKEASYDRSARRCKEKWENMNKYFRRIKESNKKRPRDSKTCLYFPQLEALNRGKSRKPKLSEENN